MRESGKDLRQVDLRGLRRLGRVQGSYKYAGSQPQISSTGLKASAFTRVYNLHVPWLPRRRAPGSTLHASPGHKVPDLPSLAHRSPAPHSWIGRPGFGSTSGPAPASVAPRVQESDRTTFIHG